MENKPQWPKYFRCDGCGAHLADPESPLHPLGFDLIICTHCRIKYKRTHYNSNSWYVFTNDETLRRFENEDKNRET